MVPPPSTPVPADEAADMWDGSRASTLFGALSLVAVGVLALGAGHLLAPLIWHGDPAHLGLVRALLSLFVAFLAGPAIILVLSASFRRLVDACHRRW